MIVLFWSKAVRDLLKSFGWGIAALHRLDAATKLPRPRRPPHSIFLFREISSDFEASAELRPIDRRRGGIIRAVSGLGKPIELLRRFEAATHRRMEVPTLMAVWRGIAELDF